VFPELSVKELPNAIGLGGFPTALPVRAMDDASAPVIDVATTRLLSPALATPVAVMRFPVPLTVRAPVELI
jgi:hypothetical protein